MANPLVPTNKYLHNLLSKDDFHVLVALQDDNLIGGLTAYELSMYKEEVNELFLYEIAVEPDYREIGVAKVLIAALKKLAVEKDIKEMYVGTSTDNLPAIKAYEKYGFYRLLTEMRMGID